MKKVIFSAAALMLASAFSFAGTPETKANSKTDVSTNSSSTLHWYKMSGTTLSFQNTATKEDEQIETGCTGQNTTECERAYDDTQLNSPGNPSAGVKPSQVNAPVDRIYVQP